VSYCTLIAPLTRVDTRFFGRIAKSYRKEKWYLILRDILKKQAECAQMVGQWGVFVESYFELMGLNMTKNIEDHVQLYSTFFDTLKVIEPS
jgi:hypothetical protein